MNRVGFIGAGNMAYAMAGALYRSNTDVPIGIYDIDNSRVDLFKSSFSSTNSYNSIKELVENVDIIVLAVKPQIIDKIVGELIDCNRVVISIAAGIKLDYLTRILPKAKVVRVMPNTPALVGAMAAGVSFSASVTNNDKDMVLEFLNLSGMALEVNENQMDAVTGLSGSGPAFVARIMDYFVQAGISQGLEPSVAKSLTVDTFLGTAKLVKEKDMDIENLIKMVSSPGGTTIAGRGVLEASPIANIIKDTVNATVKRSIELGDEC
ncbi:MAG: pyrroline-5-carboxylate reductase [Spirochaetaceae bacterium 4572_7]|nr:MAG: pyrroline-5-carboxylate reductase [Spirochaetaceae bacterium 4572_7]